MSLSFVMKHIGHNMVLKVIWIKKPGEIKYGLAKSMRDALPNATFVAFKGTPISKDDRDTQSVFGNYVSIYDIQQAQEDGATVPIYYESRLAKISLKENEVPIIDEIEIIILRTMFFGFLKKQDGKN